MLLLIPACSTEPRFGTLHASCGARCTLKPGPLPPLQLYPVCRLALNVCDGLDWSFECLLAVQVCQITQFVPIMAVNPGGCPSPLVHPYLFTFSSPGPFVPADILGCASSAADCC